MTPLGTSYSDVDVPCGRVPQQQPVRGFESQHRTASIFAARQRGQDTSQCSWGLGQSGAQQWLVVPPTHRGASPSGMSYSLFVDTQFLGFRCIRARPCSIWYVPMCTSSASNRSVPVNSQYTMPRRCIDIDIKSVQVTPSTSAQLLACHKKLIKTQHTGSVYNRLYSTCGSNQQVKG